MQKAKATKLRISSLLMVAAVLGCGSGVARANEGTLGMAIQAAKNSQKSQILSATGASLDEAQQNRPKPPPAPPVIWSLMGINGKFRAEIYYDSKIHIVDAAPGVKLGPWTIKSVDVTGIAFRQKGRKQPVYAQAPARGSNGIPELVSAYDAGPSQKVTIPNAMRMGSSLPSSVSLPPPPSQVVNRN